MPSALCELFDDRSAAIVPALSEHRLKRNVVDNSSSSQLGEASPAEHIVTLTVTKGGYQLVHSHLHRIKNLITSNSFSIFQH